MGLFGRKAPIILYCTRYQYSYVLYFEVETIYSAEKRIVYTVPDASTRMYYRNYIVLFDNLVAGIIHNRNVKRRNRPIIVKISFSTSLYRCLAWDLARPWGLS